MPFEEFVASVTWNANKSAPAHRAVLGVGLSVDLRLLKTTPLPLLSYCLAILMLTAHFSLSCALYIFYYEIDLTYFVHL